MPDTATYTNDVPADAVNVILARLRACDGRTSDAAVVCWEHCQAVVAEVERLRAVLLAYEKWEADLVLCHPAWEQPGSDGCPVIVRHLWDELMEIQAARNEALMSVCRSDPHEF